MHNDGKLIFLAVEGDHLQFSQEWFIEMIIPLLRPAEEEEEQQTNSFN